MIPYLKALTSFKNPIPNVDISMEPHFPARCMTLVTQKLSEMNAKWQLKDRPLFPYPSTHRPAVFFSGSRDDLKHAIQISCYTDDSYRVTVTVFSYLLTSNDPSWLSVTVSELNSKDIPGFFLFEDVQTRVQVRYVVNLQLNREKISDLDIKENIWSTIIRADANFKEVGRLFLSRIEEKRATLIASVKIPLQEYYEGITKALAMDRILAKQQTKGNSTIFQFPMALDTLEDSFRKCEVSLTLDDTLLQIESEFCYQSNTAIFPDSHSDLLFRLVNYLNVCMLLSVLIVTQSLTVKLLCKLQYRDVDLQFIPWTINAHIHSFHKQAESVFRNLQALYTSQKEILQHMTPEMIYQTTKVSRKSLTSTSVTEVYSNDFDTDAFQKELKEFDRVKDSEKVRNYFHFTGVEVSHQTITIKVPESYTPFTDFGFKEIILSQELSDHLLTLIQDLASNGFYYDNIDKLLYFTGEGSGKPFTLLPMDLAKNKVTTNPYIDLGSYINTRMLKHFRAFFQVMHPKDVLQNLSGIQQLNPESIHCAKNCNHRSRGWWEERHFVGLTQVTLTPIFVTGTFKDFYIFMAQCVAARKYSHPQFQSIVYGLVLFEIEDSNSEKSSAIFLVQEAPKYASLRNFIVEKRPSVEVRRQLFKQISDTVSYLHGRGQMQLFLCPSTIGVDVREKSIEIRPKLLMVPMLTPQNCVDVYRYLPSSFSKPDIDWKTVDNQSLFLIKLYLEHDEIDSFLGGFMESRQSWEMPIVKGSERLIPALKKAGLDAGIDMTKDVFSYVKVQYPPELRDEFCKVFPGIDRGR